MQNIWIFDGIFSKKINTSVFINIKLHRMITTYTLAIDQLLHNRKYQLLYRLIEINGKF